MEKGKNGKVPIKIKGRVGASRFHLCGREFARRMIWTKIGERRRE